MKKILILGNSIAGVRAIKKIRSVDQESNITLFLLENCLPYNPEFFADYIAKKIELKDVLCESEEFYKKNNVDVIANKNISRINLKKRQIATEEKEIISFDVLFITDLVERKISEVKGYNKKGVCNLVKFEPIAQVLEDLPYIETVVVHFSDFESFKLACAFRDREKEVLVIVPSGILEQVFDHEALRLIQCAFDEKGIRVIPGAVIKEILGESDAKAVKLDSEKVFSAEIISFVKSNPDLRIFKDSPMNINDKICVDENFKTNLDNIFATGHICERNGNKNSFEGYTYTEIAEQGNVAAANFLGEELAYIQPFYQEDLKIGDFSINLIGEIKRKEGVEVFVNFNEELKTYRSILAREGRVIGAVLLNATADRAKFSQIVEQNASLNDLGNVEELLGRQPSDAEMIASPIEISVSSENVGEQQEEEREVLKETIDATQDKQDLSNSCERLNNLQL